MSGVEASFGQVLRLANRSFLRLAHPCPSSTRGSLPATPGKTKNTTSFFATSYRHHRQPAPPIDKDMHILGIVNQPRLVSGLTIPAACKSAPFIGGISLCIKVDFNDENAGNRDGPPVIYRMHLLIIHTGRDAADNLNQFK